MPRAKRKSDELYNERRRAKRLVTRIEKQQFRTAREQQAAQNYVTNLQKQIERTYVSKGVEIEEAFKAAKELSVQTRREVRTASQRANEIFTREMNLASSGNESTLGANGAQYVKIFYAATQSIWEGQPLERRNKAILAAMETDSLREAFTNVLWQNRAAMKAAKHAGEPIGTTDENAFFYEDALDVEEYGSPEYLDYVSQVTR